MEVRRIAVALVAAGLVAAAPRFSHGGAAIPAFKPGDFPDNQAEFNRGKPGLITPALDKSEELIAYRILSGLTMEANSPAGLVRKPRAASPAGPFPDMPNEAWRKARATVSPAPVISNGYMATGYIDPYKVSKFGKYVYFQNCLDDAFSTAVRTLADRRLSYRDDALLSAWAQAQDRVFSNCSGSHAPNGALAPPLYPEEPGPNLPALARADRSYQIAAAHFYAEDFDAAETKFREIAQDRNSPWLQTAGYMVGRTLMREFSLANKAGAGNAARAVFQRIAADPSAGGLRDSARGLTEHLNALDHSRETMQLLADQMMNPRSDAQPASAMEQSRYVLATDAFRGAVSQPDIPDPFDWVKTLESGDEAHAVARWHATNRLPWLTVALIHASGKDDAAADLIAAANGVTADSPAWVTVTYNAIRLRIERGETYGPRAQLTRLLATERTQPVAVRDAWRALRIRVATSFDDFLRWAPRTPTNPAEFSKDPREASPVLAEDSIEVLNYDTPLAKMVEAAQSPRLPPWSVSSMARAAWIRAFMLGDTAAMNTLAPIVGKDHPEWTPDLTPQTGADADAWRFRASVLIARNAQFTPTLDVDFRRPIDPDDSWWCAVALPGSDQATLRMEQPPPTVAWRVPVSMSVPESVISRAERVQARKEIDRLEQLGSGQSVVGPVILAWAKSHPDDPLVPEALHRVTRVVRYGCHEDKNNGRLSKAAFDLLHKRYPQNPWTARTRYWYD
jgi:TolA-binding protein